MQKTIAAYLKVLERELKQNGEFQAEVLEEIEGHLLEAVETNLRRGLNQAEAEAEALRRFGSVGVVRALFEKGRITLMQKILLGIAVLAGWFALYVDTRPTWDDTGVLAFGILFVCGALALSGYRRPWLLALAVGAWIPLHGILITHNYGSLLALIFALVGAYAGWAFRAGLNKLLHAA
jgi:hypothetical protein